MEKVFEQLGPMTQNLRGNLFGIKGNVRALVQDKRFLKEDLNRMWTEASIASILSKQEGERTIEEKELFNIY